MILDNELISIIVPVYNAHKTLERCVNSICNQNYQNIEVILVNDGSKDNSLEIANKLARQDRRIKVVSQENSGVSAARNLGIQASKGKYIGFVDADDWVGEDIYLSMYTSMKDNNADLVLCNYTQVYETKYIRRNEFIGIQDNKSSLKESVLVHIISRHENNIMGTCWRMLILKELLSENDISFDLGIRMSEDMMFLIKCVHASNSIVLDENDEYYYWMNQNSATAKFIPDIWRDMMILIDWCKLNISNKYANIDIDYYLDECITNAVIVAISNSCKKNTPMNFVKRIKYSKKLCSSSFVNSSIKRTWKNKDSFPKKYWPQIICIALKLRWAVVVYHSLKHRTIFR